MAIPVGGSGSITGLARITVLSDRLRFELIDDGRRFEVFSEDHKYTKLSQKLDGEQVHIKLNESGTVLYNMSPAAGSYYGKFVGFTSKDGVPSLFHKDAKVVTQRETKKQFTLDEHMEFVAIYEVTRGKYKGLTATMSIPYAFAVWDEKAEKPITQIKGFGRNKVEKWLQQEGFDFTTDEIPFSENVLPFIEKYILSKGVIHNVAVNAKGYVDEIGDAPEDDDE